MSSTSNDTSLKRIRIELTKAMNLFSVNNTPGDAFFLFFIGKKEKKLRVKRATVNIYPKPTENLIEFTEIDISSKTIDIQFHNKEKNKPNKVYCGQISINSLLPYNTHHSIEIILDPYDKDTSIPTGNQTDVIINENIKYKDGIIPTITISCYLFQEGEDEKILSKEHPLITAVQSNSLYLVLYCLEHMKTSINQKDGSGGTALHLAATEFNNEHIILTLLKNSHVDVNVKNLDGNTPLHLFCSYFKNPNCREVFYMFLKRGADINARNRSNETPLHRAIENPTIRMLLVELLLKNGSLVNAQTGAGQTALHWAVFLQRVDLLSILLLYGADINLPNKQGETPLSMCENKYQGTAFFRTFIYILELIKYLESIGANSKSIKILVKNKMFKWNLTKVTPRILLQLGITENVEQMKLVRNFKNINCVDPEKAFKETQPKRPTFGLIPSENGWIRKKETCEYTGEVRKVEFGTLFTAILAENNTVTVVIRTFEECNDSVESFNGNTQILINLQHSGLIKYYGVIEEEKALIMEYCPDGSLVDVLQNQSIGWKLVFDLSLQILNAISYLHKQGVLHRCLKDSNILIFKRNAYLEGSEDYDEVYSVKLINFALFELGIESDKLKKMNGLYAAPEIISSETFSEKSDVYAFGLILWQLVYKCIYNVFSKPFEEYIQNSKEPQIAQQILSEDLRPVVPPPAPLRLANLLRLCVLKEPGTRPTLNEIESTLIACEKEYNNNSSLWEASIEVKQN